MGLPSRIGSVAFSAHADVTTNPRIISFTIPTGCNAITVQSSSWDSGSSPIVSSVVLINAGADPAFIQRVAHARPGTYQNSEIWTLTTNDPQWPGVGTFNIEVTYTGGVGSFQATSSGVGWQDVDPVNPVSAVTTGTMDGSSTDAQVLLTSALDEVIVGVVTHYDGSANAYSGDQTDIYTETPAGMDSNHFEQVGAVSASVGVTFPNIQAWSTVAISLQGVTAGPPTASLSSGSFLITGSNIGTLPPFVSDTFDGTGALGSHWLIQQSDPVPPPYVVDNVQRQSGYFDGDVTDNTGNRTEWFNILTGLYHHQPVDFPATGYREFIIRGIGVGPTTAPLDDLVQSASNGYAFAGVMVHDGNGFSSPEYEFTVVGHRGTSAEATIETKSTSGGVSSVADEGNNVFTGTGVTHGDIRVRLKSDRTVEFAFRDIGAIPWILINAGGATPGATPAGNKPTFGSSVHIGLIIYAETSFEVPFTGSADSFIEVTPGTDLSSGSFVLTGSTIDTFYNRVSSFSSGSFVITGSTIDTIYTPLTPTISIESNSFVLTGSTIDTFYNRVSSFSSGSFVITGSVINTLYGHVSSIESNSFILTGSTIGTIFGSGAFTSGSFLITGSNIDFLYDVVDANDINLTSQFGFADINLTGDI